MYDSSIDTDEHKKCVTSLLNNLILELAYRKENHDNSKLESPEKEVLDEHIPKLKGLTYWSDEYQKQLTQLEPATVHHYRVNRHHPEHFQNGINDMTLVGCAGKTRGGGDG
jgi:hypothetical protein